MKKSKFSESQIALATEFMQLHKDFMPAAETRS
jgi:hypothetical protein